VSLDVIDQSNTQAVPLATLEHVSLYLIY